MKLKTKEFQLNEETTFKNEIIHFFNIDANNSTINIYLEIDGKIAKSEKSKKKCHKLILKDKKIKKEKQELNCSIIEDVELKILIRIINKVKNFFRKKSKTVYKTFEEESKKRERKKTVITNDLNENKSGMTIKDKIQFFSGNSGEFNKKPSNEKLPGKLKMPKIFLNEKEKENKDNKKKVDK